jgi:hypothetical protein
MKAVVPFAYKDIVTNLKRSIISMRKEKARVRSIASVLIKDITSLSALVGGVTLVSVSVETVELLAAVLVVEESLI